MDGTFILGNRSGHELFSQQIATLLPVLEVGAISRASIPISVGFCFHNVNN